MLFFSSPDPKGHVRYCHHLASVVRPSSVVRRLSSVVRRPKSGRVKPPKGSQPSLLDIWISNSNTDINKQLKKLHRSASTQKTTHYHKNEERDICIVPRDMLLDQVRQWLAAGRWFSDRHDIAEILLKVALNTKTLTLYFVVRLPYWVVPDIFVTLSQKWRTRYLHCTERHVAQLGHNILTPSQPIFVLTSYCCVLGRETTILIS
jgi:hypothetical protein